MILQQLLNLLSKKHSFALWLEHTGDCLYESDNLFKNRQPLDSFLCRRITEIGIDEELYTLNIWLKSEKEIEENQGCTENAQHAKKYSTPQ